MLRLKRAKRERMRPPIPDALKRQCLSALSMCLSFEGLTGLTASSLLFSLEFRIIVFI